MRAPLRRPLVPVVFLCLGIIAVKLILFNHPRPPTILNLLELVDENGELTDGFKEELLLKDRILKEEADGDAKAYQVTDLYGTQTVDRRGHYMEGSAWYNAGMRTSENLPDDVLSMPQPVFLRNYKNPCWLERRVPEGDGTHIATDNDRVRCLPYFHLMGVDKSGTTDLWYRLAQHPHMVRPKAVMGKETHWWSWRRFGYDIWVKNREIRHFDWYLQHFDDPSKKIEQNVLPDGYGIRHHFITGEGSPTVFWDFTGWTHIPQNSGKAAAEALLTPECIKHLTPDAKFLVIIRNPTDRLYSDYLFLDQFKSQHNLSVEGFNQDVRRSLAMLTGCFTERSESDCLLDKQLHMTIPVRVIVGLYDYFLERWLRVFPADHILVLRSEDYSRNVQYHVAEVFKFLGLETLPDGEMERIARLPRVFEKSANAKKLGPMMKETRNLLDNFYQRYNEKLAKRLNSSVFLWQH
ncbi:carbohydrate sulfotransferase 15 [Plakobranchus ocellatus]|uniref:Carbohydrate sulfotransferase 15 n=1 Tax=Plakobranchus ocellatus TaxID=259542 RepID=A0AAV4DCU8_9GAST|nr:carbohydrate sulfotransferase 15 [Plakobranchus ocellatus]